MTSAAPEPREVVRGRGTLERDMKINQRLLSIGSPLCQITEQKPLCFVLTVRYARHTPLDTAPCWPGGATSTQSHGQPSLRVEMKQTERLFLSFIQPGILNSNISKKG